MELFVGTSGYSYKEWKGSFYPEKISPKEMLACYAERLSSVEINNTFYRLPRENVLTGWAGQVPDGFRFSIKASRRITHFKRLNPPYDETDYLLETVSVLGAKLGVVLFQLPPNMKKERDRLEAFVSHLPNGIRAAFEFRHDSWFDDETYDVLRKKNCALCLADTDEKEAEVVSTADWGYLRLRRAAYGDDELGAWAKNIAGLGWNESFVFFKHEDEAAGPKMAERFRELARG